MSEQAGPQYAKIAQPLGHEPPVVHCPVCGNPTITVVDEREEITPCAHLVFVFVGEVGVFEYQSEDFKGRCTRVDPDELSTDNFEAFLEAAGYDNGLLALEITYGGMGCGPVWYTDLFGFEFGPRTTKG